MDLMVYEALRKAIETNRDDLCARASFKDFAIEQGIVSCGHDWEDVSYHGSPDWECKNCRESSWRVEVKGEHLFDFCVPCAKPGKTLQERERTRQEEEEKRERVEYAKMKVDRERWNYLHEKYGEES